MARNRSRNTRAERTEPPSQGAAQALIGVIATAFICISVEYLWRENDLAAAVLPGLIGLLLFFLSIFWPRLVMAIAPNFAGTAARAATDFRVWLASVLLLFLGIAVRPALDYLPPPIAVPFTYILGYGAFPQHTNAISGLYIIADGHRLLKFASNYQLVGAAFHSAPQNDIRDATLTLKSKPYDIVADQINIVMPLTDSPQFVAEAQARKFDSTQYVLLLVPKRVKASQYTTIHEAESIGAGTLQATSGPP